MATHLIIDSSVELIRNSNFSLLVNRWKCALFPLTKLSICSLRALYNGQLSKKWISVSTSKLQWGQIRCSYLIPTYLPLSIKSLCAEHLNQEIMNYLHPASSRGDIEGTLRLGLLCQGPPIAWCSTLGYSTCQSWWYGIPIGQNCWKVGGANSGDVV